MADTVQLNFRVTDSEGTLRVLHGDDNSPLMTIEADRETRAIAVKVEDTPKVSVVGMSVDEQTVDHNTVPADGVDRNWRHTDDALIVWHPETDKEITLYKAKNGDGTHVPSGVPETLGQNKLVYEVAMSIVTGQHLLLIGPTGTAKSTLLMWFAQELGYNHVLMPVSRDTEARDFIGEYLPANGGGLEWIDGPVSTATRLSLNHPTILVFDELNRIGNVSHFARIYSLLDGQRKLVIPDHRDENQEAEVIPAGELHVMGTANPADAADDDVTATDYIGVQELDSALSSRFVFQPKIGYPEAAMEAAALRSRVSVSEATATKMVDAANRVRFSHEVRWPMSFRELHAWAIAYKYLSYEAAAEIAVISKAPPMFAADLRRLLFLQGDK